MRHLLTLLALCISIISAQAAEQWRSDRYGCSLTFPEGESWVQGTPLPLPAGEMIYTATHAQSKQSIAVMVIPKIPNNDLENPSVINRIMEPINHIGYQVISHAPVVINGEKFLQLAGRRGETATVSIICLARASLRENTLYIALTSARGDEDLTSDKHFLRVIDTFSFATPAGKTERVATGELVPLYITTYKATAIAIGALLVIGIFAVALSRRQHA